MPTQQTILEIGFADSESDSDDEIVESLGSSNRHIAKQMGVGSRLFEGFESDLWSAETA